MHPRDTCRTCGEPLQHKRVPVVHGEDSGWTARLLDYPVLACPRDHERWEASPDFNARWSDELAEPRSELWARTSGLIRKRLLCAGCGEELSAPPRTRISCQVLLGLGGTEEFTIEVHGPLLQCQACTRRQVDPRDGSEVFDALVNALERASIKRR